MAEEQVSLEQPAEESIETPAEELEGSAPPEEIADGQIEATGLEGEAEIDTRPQVKGKAEERIGALTRKWREAERRAAYYEGFAKGKAEGASSTPGTQIEPPPTTSVEPRQEDFEDYDAYIKALTDYKVDQKIVQYQRDATNKAEQDRIAQNQTDFQAKLAEGSARYDDFDEVVGQNDLVPITNDMVEILKDTEYPADIAYYLGKNIKECTMISKMPKLQAARVLGRIEAEIARDLKANPKPTATTQKKITTAPQPITPIGSAETVTKDPNKMSQTEYEQWRKEGGGR